MRGCICVCVFVPFGCYGAKPKVQRLPYTESPCLYCPDSIVTPSRHCLEERYADNHQRWGESNQIYIYFFIQNDKKDSSYGNTGNIWIWMTQHMDIFWCKQPLNQTQKNMSDSVLPHRKYLGHFQISHSICFAFSPIPTDRRRWQRNHVAHNHRLRSHCMQDAQETWSFHRKQ